MDDMLPGTGQLGSEFNG